MLTIKLIQPSVQINYSVQNKQTRFSHPQYDRVTFGLKYSVGKCPKELQHLKIVDLNQYSKNVVEVNDIGYLAEIIKYFEPKTKKTYAIKRVWAPDKAKKQNTNPIEQMKVEAEIYKKIPKMKNVPKFYYYNGNFAKNQKSALNNYLIMSWVDGGIASRRGIVYDTELVNPNSIGKIFKMLAKFDESGVIHNDLWAGNILFTKKNVNIIDFNRSYSFNPNIQLKENNLESFKTRFLNRYFSDVYNRKGEAEYLKTYSQCLKAEEGYYRARQVYYLKNRNMDGFAHYKSLSDQLSEEIKNPDLLKKKAISTVFDSDIHCADIYTKYFEFNDDEAEFHLKKALKSLKSHPEILGGEKADLLKSNLMVISSLKEIIKNGGKNQSERVNSVLKLLENDKVYDPLEQKKPYYNLFKSFCNFNLEYFHALKTGQNLELVVSEYSELFKTRRLYDFLNNLNKS